MVIYLTSESLPERALPETFLLSTHQAAGIMSLSQQTAALVLRQDRDAIKKYNQFILMQESKLLSSNFIKERLVAAKYGNDLLIVEPPRKMTAVYRLLQIFYLAVRQILGV